MQMKKEEMLRRLQAGEDPLDLSIEKWERLVEKGGEVNSINYISANTCALCYELQNTVSRRYDCCKGCPLLQVEGGHCCETNSLWRAVFNARNSQEEFVQRAREMLAGLQEAKRLQQE